MASHVSTQPAPGTIRFSADFAANVPRYQTLIRRQPLMRWAKAFRLEEDLEQLTLLELARVEPRFDPTRAASNAHFFSAVVASRVSDSFRLLKRQHRDVVDDKHVSLNDDYGSDGDGDGEELGARIFVDETGPDVVVADAMRRQAVTALRAAIEHLSTRQREVIELVLGDLTDAEIAAQLGVSVQAVNKTKLAAIANLKQLVPAGHASA